MASLIRRLSGERSIGALGIDDWFQQIVGYAGNTYGTGLNTTISGNAEAIGNDFAGYISGGYRGNGAVFACMALRMRLFSEARFQFRRLTNGRPGDLFGTRALAPLETPWPNGTTGDLLTRMILDADCAGNAFVTNRDRNMRRLRPDWVEILLGSKTGAAWDLEPIAYAFHPNGITSTSDPDIFLPEEVAHFAPIPDPMASYRGMSWLTPVIREVEGDTAASNHKLKFFDHGATPNLVVKFAPELKKEAADNWIAKFKLEHEGTANAYRTLFLGGGADATVVGANLKEIDFKVVQGAGETRIAAAAGLPPICVGFSEGLSAATYSNYGQARRSLADATLRPLWRNVSGSLAPLIQVPAGAELWYDPRDVAFLREDEKDAAEIEQVKGATISGLTHAGFTPESAVAAVMAADMRLLQHSGLFSVQLWEPGTGTAPESPAHPKGSTTNP